MPKPVSTVSSTPDIKSLVNAYMAALRKHGGAFAEIALSRYLPGVHNVVGKCHHVRPCDRASLIADLQAGPVKGQTAPPVVKDSLNLAVAEARAVKRGSQRLVEDALFGLVNGALRNRFSPDGEAALIRAFVRAFCLEYPVLNDVAFLTKGALVQLLMDFVGLDDGTTPEETDAAASEASCLVDMFLMERGASPQKVGAH